MPINPINKHTLKGIISLRHMQRTARVEHTMQQNHGILGGWSINNTIMHLEAERSLRAMAHRLFCTSAHQLWNGLVWQLWSTSQLALRLM